MEHIQTLAHVKTKLQANGYSGLYSPGECACHLAQLAPCGHYRTGKGQGNYINGCKPGHLHLDPRPGHAEYGDFIVTDTQTPPDEDQFDDDYT